jgi:transposase
LPRIARDDLLCGNVVPLAGERDVDTLRQISRLLERENQRLITQNLQLTTELARLRGLPEVAQLTFAIEQTLHQTRAAILGGAPAAPAPAIPRPPRPGHGPREQPALPVIEVRHELAPDQRGCPACGGTLTELAGQYETAERITTVKATYHVQHHARQKYRCACNGAVVTAPAPPTLIPGGRYTPAFAVSVAVAKYTDHLPLERQVRMMAREGLIVESQTLWDQIQAPGAASRAHLRGLGRQALAVPAIHVDETRWPRLGSDAQSAGTVWGLATPTIAFYRILPGKSADEGRQFLGGYRGTVVVDGYAVYEVLARDGPHFALAHCWAHTKRKYDAIAEHWPTACAEITELIGDLYAVERLVPGRFPGDAAAQALRQQLR